jgi:dsDNA-specific endonuclease/ATPase MutS2
MKMFNEEELEAICLFVKGKNKGEALNGDDILQINSALRNFNDEVLDFEDFTEIIYNASMVNSNALLPDFEEHYQNCLSVEENIYEFLKWSESEEQ